MPLDGVEVAFIHLPPSHLATSNSCGFRCRCRCSRCHIRRRRHWEASMLWNFAFASAVCSLQSEVYSLQPEVAAAVIAARFVFISIVVFALSAFFRRAFCQAPHCLPAAIASCLRCSIHRPLTIPSAELCHGWVQWGGRHLSYWGYGDALIKVWRRSEKEKQAKLSEPIICSFECATSIAFLI